MQPFTTMSDSSDSTTACVGMQSTVLSENINISFPQTVTEKIIEQFYRASARKLRTAVEDHMDIAEPFDQALITVFEDYKEYDTWGIRDDDDVIEEKVTSAIWAVLREQLTPELIAKAHRAATARLQGIANDAVCRLERFLQDQSIVRTEELEEVNSEAPMYADPEDAQEDLQCARDQLTLYGKAVARVEKFTITITE
jgi:hypothetical protein